MKNAVVLLSGGLDSTTTLYYAKSKGYKCNCLIFDYGQRHRREIESAKKIARVAHCPYKIIKFSLPWKGSSLLDRDMNIPQGARSPGHQGTRSPEKEIPSTYVPARNSIFLGFAISYAEAIKAEVIFIGANAIDYSGYPDCRPEFYRAFDRVISTGTKTGVEKKNIKIKTPLIFKTKAKIIRLGRRLGIPFELTWSCYRGEKNPCGICDSCILRAKGFREIGLPDPLNNG